jgi:hypothetical protein
MCQFFLNGRQARPSAAGRPPLLSAHDDGSQQQGADDRGCEPDSAVAETPARELLNKLPVRARLRCRDPGKWRRDRFGVLASLARAGPDRQSLTRGAR